MMFLGSIKIVICQYILHVHRVIITIRIKIVDLISVPSLVI